MIPLSHNNTPTELENYVKLKGQSLTIQDFSAHDFQGVKKIVRDRLHTLQGELCVYCEKKYSVDEMQVEHIKPKSGRNAQPNLCFTYSNYAVSCIQENRKTQTCGQKKKDNILFIEPTSPSCNSHFSLDTDGFINPRGFKNRKEKHSIQTTIDMLGLNKPHLQLERLIYILKATKHNRHELTNKFIKSGNFKYILRELTM